MISLPHFHSKFILSLLPQSEENLSDFTVDHSPFRIPIEKHKNILIFNTEMDISNGKYLEFFLEIQQKTETLNSIYKDLYSAFKLFLITHKISVVLWINGWNSIDFIAKLHTDGILLFQHVDMESLQKIHRLYNTPIIYPETTVSDIDLTTEIDHLFLLYYPKDQEEDLFSEKEKNEK